MHDPENHNHYPSACLSANGYYGDVVLPYDKALDLIDGAIATYGLGHPRFFDARIPYFTAAGTAHHPVGWIMKQAGYVPSPEHQINHRWLRSVYQEVFWGNPLTHALLAEFQEQMDKGKSMERAKELAVRHVERYRASQDPSWGTLDEHTQEDYDRRADK